MNDLKKAQSISGFSTKREPMDNYPTPDIAVIELLKRERFDGVVWEPCCGSGNIARHFDNCIATDIRTNVYGRGGIDFLNEYKNVDCIVTNPPFRLAKEFVEHSLECSSDKVAMLLKLAFLESRSRYDLFKHSPLKTVWVFSNRLPWIREGENTMEGKSSMIPFAWFVWEKGYSGLPYIDGILLDADNGRAKTTQTHLSCSSKCHTTPRFEKRGMTLLRGA
jgi:hypothetical protein